MFQGYDCADSSRLDQEGRRMKQAKILIAEDSGFFRKAMAHETPVIVLSGDMVERDVTEAKLGINYYFQKDQSPIGKLVTVIRTTVRVPA
jgi:hypothetical protein